MNNAYSKGSRCSVTVQMFSLTSGCNGLFDRCLRDKPSRRPIAGEFPLHGVAEPLALPRKNLKTENYKI